MFLRRALWAVALVPLTFAACAETDDEGGASESTQLENLGQISAPIINGSLPNAPMHKAVVSLHDVQFGYIYLEPFCSGTLITPDVVVTAAHCLDIAKGGSVAKPIAPAALSIYVGDKPKYDRDPHFFPVKEVLLHPSYDRINLLGDIGLVRLATPVPAALAVPVPGLPQALGFTSADVKVLTLNFAGFGVDQYNKSGIKLQADGKLGGLGCTVAGCYGPHDPKTQISYTQYASGPCYGDSGGPAFLYRNGLPYVGGITSWGDTYCVQFGVSTRVDAFEQWIGTFVSPPVCTADGTCNAACAQGADPDCAPDCSADGACNAQCPAGSDPDCAPPPPPSTCGNGTCDTGESCDGRYGTLACNGDCPGVTSGKPTKRFCYVGGICEGPACP